MNLECLLVLQYWVAVFFLNQLDSSSIFADPYWLACSFFSWSPYRITLWAVGRFTWLTAIWTQLFFLKTLQYWNFNINLIFTSGLHTVKYMQFIQGKHLKCISRTWCCNQGRIVTQSFIIVYNTNVDACYLGGSRWFFIM